MRTKWNDAQLTTAIERYNAMADGLRVAGPLVADVLNGERITGASVGKRARDKVNAIIAEHVTSKGAWARCFLDTQYTFTLYLHADFNAPTGEHSVTYAEMTIPVAEKSGDEWKGLKVAPRAPRTVASVKADIEAAEMAEEAARVARSAASNAMLKAAPFAGE